MTRKLNLFLISLWIILLSSCTAYQAVYDVGLSQVTRPLNATEQYGEYSIVDNDTNNKFTYVDGLIEGVFVLGEKSVIFGITNKTSHIIKINWDEAAFIDENGNSSRVVHSGIRYVDMNSPQSPSIIIGGGKFQDVATPTSNVHFSQQSGWYSRDILLNFSYNRDELIGWSNGYIGKELKLLLPLVIEGVQNDYIFTFRVNSSEILNAAGVQLVW